MIVQDPKGNKYRLPLIAQYDSIPYEPMLCCSHCYHFRSGYGNWMEEMSTDKVVGYVVNPEGEYEIVLECKYCGQKYRFHMFKEYPGGIYDAEGWKDEIALHLLVRKHDYLKIVTEE